jgi:transposase
LQLQEPPDHALGRSRGGFGSKIHLLVEDHGLVVGIFLTAGQRHESVVFEELMGRALPCQGRPRRWPKQVAADKAYNAGHIRAWLWRHHIEGVIPTPENQPRLENFDKAAYRKRNLIERVVGWYKECRRLGTRYEKLAVNVLAFWIVAAIEKLLHRRAVYVQ